MADARQVRIARSPEGLGLVIDGLKETIVTSLHPNGPAERAGVCVGDRIVNVNGFSVLQKSRLEVVELIKTSSDSVDLGLLHSPELLEGLRDAPPASASATAISRSPTARHSSISAVSRIRYRQATPRFRNRASTAAAGDGGGGGGAMAKRGKPLPPPPARPQLGADTSPDPNCASPLQPRQQQHRQDERRVGVPRLATPARPRTFVPRQHAGPGRSQSLTTPPSSGRHAHPHTYTRSPASTHGASGSSPFLTHASPHPTAAAHPGRGDGAGMGGGRSASLGAASSPQSQRDYAAAYLGVCPVLRTREDAAWTFLDVAHPVAMLQRAHASKQSRTQLFDNPYQYLDPDLQNGTPDLLSTNRPRSHVTLASFSPAQTALVPIASPHRLLYHTPTRRSKYTSFNDPEAWSTFYNGHVRITKSSLSFVHRTGRVRHLFFMRSVAFVSTGHHKQFVVVTRGAGGFFCHLFEGDGPEIVPVIEAFAWTRRYSDASLSAMTSPAVLGRPSGARFFGTATSSPSLSLAPHPRSLRRAASTQPPIPEEGKQQQQQQHLHTTAPGGSGGGGGLFDHTDDDDNDDDNNGEALHRSFDGSGGGTRKQQQQQQQRAVTTVDTTGRRLAGRTAGITTPMHRPSLYDERHTLSAEEDNALLRYSEQAANHIRERDVVVMEDESRVVLRSGYIRRAKIHGRDCWVRCHRGTSLKRAIVTADDHASQYATTLAAVLDALDRLRPLHSAALCPFLGFIVSQTNVPLSVSIAYERQSGETPLANVLRHSRDPPFLQSPAGRLRLACDVAMGMSALHAAGIVHGVVSAHCIRVDPAGAARMADFGAAPLLLEASDVALLRYRAPEVMLDPSAADAAADIYSLALLIVEIMDLKHPLAHCHTADACMYAAGRIGDVVAVPSALPGDFARCWSLDPVSRPSATAVQSFLTEAEDSIGLNATAARTAAAPALDHTQSSSPSNALAQGLSVHLRTAAATTAADEALPGVGMGTATATATATAAGAAAGAGGVRAGSTKAVVEDDAVEAGTATGEGATKAARTSASSQLFDDVGRRLAASTTARPLHQHNLHNPQSFSSSTASDGLAQLVEKDSSDLFDTTLPDVSPIQHLETKDSEQGGVGQEPAFHTTKPLLQRAFSHTRMELDNAAHVLDESMPADDSVASFLDTSASNFVAGVLNESISDVLSARTQRLLQSTSPSARASAGRRSGFILRPLTDDTGGASSPAQTPTEAAATGTTTPATKAAATATEVAMADEPSVALDVEHHQQQQHQEQAEAREKEEAANKADSAGQGEEGASDREREGDVSTDTEARLRALEDAMASAGEGLLVGGDTHAGEQRGQRRADGEMEEGEKQEASEDRDEGSGANGGDVQSPPPSSSPSPSSSSTAAAATALGVSVDGPLLPLPEDVASKSLLATAASSSERKEDVEEDAVEAEQGEDVNNEVEGAKMEVEEGDKAAASGQEETHTAKREQGEQQQQQQQQQQQHVGAVEGQAEEQEQATAPTKESATTLDVAAAAADDEDNDDDDFFSMLRKAKQAKQEHAMTWDPEAETELNAPEHAHVEGPHRWAISFNHLLASSGGMDCLQGFARDILCEENVRFWRDAKQLRTVQEEDVFSTVHRIYNTYFRKDAPLWLNIESIHRPAIEQALQKDPPPRSIFASAQKEVYHLMLRDTYPKFLDSKRFKKAVKKWEQQKKRGGGGTSSARREEGAGAASSSGRTDKSAGAEKGKKRGGIKALFSRKKGKRKEAADTSTTGSSSPTLHRKRTSTLFSAFSRGHRRPPSTLHKLKEQQEGEAKASDSAVGARRGSHHQHTSDGAGGGASGREEAAAHATPQNEGPSREKQGDDRGDSDDKKDKRNQQATSSTQGGQEERSHASHAATSTSTATGEERDIACATNSGGGDGMGTTDTTIVSSMWNSVQGGPASRGVVFRICFGNDYKSVVKAATDMTLMEAIEPFLDKWHLERALMRLHQADTDEVLPWESPCTAVQGKEVLLRRRPNLRITFQDGSYSQVPVSEDLTVQEALLACFDKRGMSLTTPTDKQWLVMAGDRVASLEDRADKYCGAGLSLFRANNGRSVPAGNEEAQAEAPSSSSSSSIAAPQANAQQQQLQQQQQQQLQQLLASTSLSEDVSLV